MTYDQNLFPILSSEQSWPLSPIRSSQAESNLLNIMLRRQHHLKTLK